MKKNYFLITAVALILSLSLVSAYTQTNFTVSGTYTTPVGVNYVFVEVWGAGGGGGACSASSSRGGSGGGGGGYSAALHPTTYGQNWTVTVGAAGAGGAGGANPGNAGGNSVFNSSGTNTTALGGGGGAINAGAGGTGGQASSGTGELKTSGGSGGTGAIGNTGVGFGAGGGGGAGTQSNGQIGSGTTTNVTGGVGGVFFGGDGGNGAIGDSGGGQGNSRSSGGGGAYCDGSSSSAGGGNGNVGEIRVTEIDSSFDLYYFEVRDINTLSLVTNQTNLSFVDQTSLIEYNFSTSSGKTAGFLTQGDYFVTIEAGSYDVQNNLLSVDGDNSSQTIIYYVDNQATEVQFLTATSVGEEVGNATISFSRNVNGSVVVVSQVKTDFSGSANVFLDSSINYLFTATHPDYPTRTDVIKPVQSAYNIIFTVGNVERYVPLFQDVSYNTSGNYTNTTQVVNFTFDVISSVGNIDYFGMQVEYNNTVYTDSVSGVPGGGSLYLNFTVDLDPSDTFTVYTWVKATNYSLANWSTSYFFYDYTPTNTSIAGGLFGTTYSPSSVSGKAILATMIVLIIAGLVFSVTSSVTVSSVVAMAIIGLFTLPTIGWFNWYYGLLTVITFGLLIVGDNIGN